MFFSLRIMRFRTRAIIAVIISILLITFMMSFLSISHYELPSKYAESLKTSFSNLLPDDDEVQQQVKEERLVHPSVIKYLIEEENISSHFGILKKTPETDIQLLEFDRAKVKSIYPEVINSIYDRIDKDAVDWSKYAYVLYATAAENICNAMMILAELKKFGTRANLVMLVKEEFLSGENEFSEKNETLTKFAEDYNVILKPVKEVRFDEAGPDTWASSNTKLMVFNQTEYERIIYMDSDAILTKGNLDELFFLPPCKLAIPNAFWITDDKLKRLGKKRLSSKYGGMGFAPLTYEQRKEKVEGLIKEKVDKFLDSNDNLPIYLTKLQDKNLQLMNDINQKNFYTNIYNNLPDLINRDEFMLTSIMMVIQPTTEMFENIQRAISQRHSGEWDMDILQKRLFSVKSIPNFQMENSFKKKQLSFEERVKEVPEVLILPHQVYGQLSGVMNKETNHQRFMVESHDQAFYKLGLETSNGDPPYYDISWRENPSEYSYKPVKYVHFSDSPMPKPWVKLNPQNEYMKYRARCPSHPDFNKDNVVKPGTKTDDCSMGKDWENVFKMFEDIRKEVCHLDLVVENRK